MTVVLIISILIGIFGILVTGMFLLDFKKAKDEDRLEKDTSFWKTGLVGFICCFLDVLGIGAFATITALSKSFRLIRDKVLPGTLIVSTAIYSFIFAILFVQSIDVDTATLAVMVVCCAVGAFFGAGIVAKLPEKKIRLGMGIALGIIAVFILLGQLNLMPVGGEAMGVSNGRLVIVAVLMLFMGGIMTIGVGIFAPTMAIVYMMGMSPLAAFPIMMAAASIAQPTAGFKFIKEGSLDRVATLAIAVCGIASGLIAYFAVKSMPLTILKWIVLAVVVYTSIRMFMSYRATPAGQD